MREPSDLKVPATPFKSKIPRDLSPSPSPLQLSPASLDVFARQRPSEVPLIESFIPPPSNDALEPGFVYGYPLEYPASPTSFMTSTTEVKSFFDFDDSPPNTPALACTKKFFESLRRRSRSNPDPQTGHKKGRSRSKSIPVEEIKNFLVEHLSSGNASSKAINSNSSHALREGYNVLSDIEQDQHCTLKDFLAESQPNFNEVTTKTGNNTHSKQTTKRRKSLFGSSRSTIFSSADQENVPPTPLLDVSHSQTRARSRTLKDFCYPTEIQSKAPNPAPPLPSQNSCAKVLKLRSSLKDLRASVRSSSQVHQRHKSTDEPPRVPKVVTKKASQPLLNPTARRAVVGLAMTPITNATTNVTIEKGPKDHHRNQTRQHSVSSSSCCSEPTKMRSASRSVSRKSNPDQLSVDPSSESTQLLVPEPKKSSSRRLGACYSSADLEHIPHSESEPEIEINEVSFSSDATAWWKDVGNQSFGNYHGENDEVEDDDLFSLCAYEDAAEFRPPSSSAYILANDTIAGLANSTSLPSPSS